MHRDSDIHRDTNEINSADYRFVYMGAKGIHDVAIFSFLFLHVFFSKIII